MGPSLAEDINRQFSSSPPEIHSAIVTDKSVWRRRGGEFRKWPNRPVWVLHIAATNPESNLPSEVYVSDSQFNAIKPSQSIELEILPGALGVPIVMDVRNN